MFPGVRQIELDDLREMAFGKFEGRAVQELVKDPEFAQWVDPTSRTVKRHLLNPEQVPFYIPLFRISSVPSLQRRNKTSVSP